MNKNIIIGIVALLGLVLVISFFVGKKDSTNPTSENETAEVQPDANRSLSDAKDFGVPIYPDTEILSATDSEEGDVRHMTLSLEADAGVAEINEWYREALSTDGWSIKSDRSIGGYTIIQAENGDKYTSMQAARGENPDPSIISQQIRVGETGGE